MRAMVDLARQTNGKPVTMKEIARRQGIKPKYLEQILRKLRKAGLIQSIRGPGGGYILKKDPKSIRLSEIIEAVGESTYPVFCVAKRPSRSCLRAKNCPTRSYWKELDDLILTFFKKRTLEDVCQGRS